MRRIQGAHMGSAIRGMAEERWTVATNTKRE